MSSKKLKKDLQKKVMETLTNTFEEFKKDITSKKFKRNIRKASRALLAGLTINTPKKTAVKKSSIKKEVKQEKILEPVTIE